MPITIGSIKLFKVEEVLNAFAEGDGKLSKQTIRKYIRDKKLKGRKVGGIWWVTEDSLREWLGAGPEVPRQANA